jgi:hypothetical protein
VIGVGVRDVNGIKRPVEVGAAREKAVQIVRKFLAPIRGRLSLAAGIYEDRAATEFEQCCRSLSDIDEVGGHKIR